MSDARTTLLTAETLGISFSEARITRITSETLTGGVSDARIPWLGVEVLMATTEAEVFGKVESLSVDVLNSAVSTSQTEILGLEVFNSAASEAQIPYISVEVLFSSKRKNSLLQKFNNKSLLLFGKVQENPNTAPNIAGTDVIPALNLTLEDKIDSSVIPYGENAVGRSADIAINNVTRTVEFETLFSIFSGENFPLGVWLEACGGVLIESPNKISFSNENVSTKRLYLEFHRFPEDDPENKNTYGVENAVGTVGFNLTAGKLCKLNFSFSGNPKFPTYSERVLADFQNQKFQVLGALRKANLLSARITDLETGNSQDLCFYKLQTDNLFGYAIENLETSLTNFSERVVSNSTVALTVLLNTLNSVEDFTPEFCLGRRYSLKLSLGSFANSVDLEFSELCLLDYKQQKIGEVAGMSLGFLNTGITTLSFSAPMILE